MSDETYSSVFDMLLDKGSMAFLELSALSHLDDPQLVAILDDLEKKGLVWISDKNDVFKQVISIRQKAMTASPSFGD